MPQTREIPPVGRKDGLDMKEFKAGECEFLRGAHGHPGEGQGNEILEVGINLGQRDGFVSVLRSSGDPETAKSHFRGHRSEEIVRLVDIIGIIRYFKSDIVR